MPQIVHSRARREANLLELHSYSCNGRCGAGCTGAALGNAYTQDCFSHDICSWFNNASGGSRYVLQKKSPSNMANESTD